MAKVDENLEKLIEQERELQHAQKTENILCTILGFGTGLAITTIAIVDYLHNGKSYFSIIASLWAAGYYYLGWRSYKNLKS
jgi:hypothetical protein